MQIEEKSIEFIPEEQRHGKPRSLIFIWFGINMIVLAVTMGTLPSTLGLNLAWSLLAIIIVGNLFGAPLYGVPLRARSAPGRSADDPEPRAVWRHSVL